MTDHAADLIILEPDKIDVPAAELGEGPCWDADTQSLYWVDIPASRVHRLSADGRALLVGRRLPGWRRGAAGRAADWWSPRATGSSAWTR